MPEPKVNQSQSGDMIVKIQNGLRKILGREDINKNTLSAVEATQVRELLEQIHNNTERIDSLTKSLVDSLEAKLGIKPEDYDNAQLGKLINGQEGRID